MAGATSSNGLLRWLLGGLVVGGIVLGLLVAAYEIGYHHRPAKAGSASTNPPPATTTKKPSGGGATAQGEKLFASDGCAGCHSLDGSAGAGPTVKGLAGSSVRLTDGRTVTAGDAYLAKSITDPDAEIVQGYQKGVMSGATASFDLAAKPTDVAALVAFIKTQR